MRGPKRSYTPPTPGRRLTNLDKKRPLANRQRRMTGARDWAGRSSREGRVGQTSLVERDSGTGEVFELVHARFLRFFPDLVEEVGGDPKILMSRAGIEFDILSDGKSGATYRQLVHLIELAAAELRCPDFGMRLAKLQGGGGMFGPLGLVMKNSKTFGDALHYVSKHTYAHSLAARIWL